MSGEEEFYKREEDRKWRERVDERLVGLTTDATVSNDRLDEHDERLVQLDEVLRGNPADKNDGGIENDLRELSVGLNTLRALMAPDALGNGGLINRLKALEDRAKREEKSSEYRWKFWTAVAVASISLVGLGVENTEKISNAVGNLFHVRIEPAPKIVKRGHRRKNRVVDPSPEANDVTNETLQE